MSGGSRGIPSLLELPAEQLQPVDIVDFEAHGGGQELDRVVGLEIGRLVGDQRVGRGMGLVEAVARELRHQLEDAARIGLRATPLASAPLTKVSRCASISALIFLPMARRRRSAEPRL